MKEYPTAMGVAGLAEHDHISDAELAKDIADTQAEVDGYRRVQVAEEEIARAHPSDTERQLAEFRAMARPAQVRQREQFIAFLKLIQRARVERASQRVVA